MTDRYVNRGTDPRILGSWGGWVQQKLSFKAAPEPLQLLLAWPPYLSVAIPYPWRARAWGWRYATFRAGWRFDKNWRGYIFDIIVKLRMTQVVHY